MNKRRKNKPQQKRALCSVTREAQSAWTAAILKFLLASCVLPLFCTE